MQTLLVQVTAIVGSTITVEGSADNSSYSAVGFGQNVTAGPPGTSITNGVITANGRYVFRITTPFIRVRISTYVGPGNVVALVDLSTEPLMEITRQVDNGLTATGTTTNDALPLQAVYNRFTTVAASTGCRLPEAPGALYEVVIRNNGANAVLIYPPTGRQINGGASASLGASGTFRCVTDSSLNYWTF
jgi:hypothetical protein